ncbi:MAG: carboxylesterase [Xanthomonadales bacterium]|nr:carboxylesterase [Xanthomonadales bacterium]
MDKAIADLDYVELHTGPAPQWTIVWLHGLGADGHDFEGIVPELVRPHWPHLRFVFPHAPVRAVTVNGGARMRAWYDILGPSLAEKQDIPGVEGSVAAIEKLLQAEIARGCPPERMILAGFSQGGAITLARGLTREQPLAAMVVLSSYVPIHEHLLPQTTAAAATMPLFMAHGRFDPVVPEALGLLSKQFLEGVGITPEWHSYAMAHQVCLEEITDLANWLEQRFG